AFGHNADDMAATFMLNSFRNGRIQTLGIAEGFFDNSLLVIRPLLLVEKRYIRQAARKWQLPFWQNACPTSGKTARSEMDAILEDISLKLPEARKSLVSALGRRELELAARQRPLPAAKKEDK
ncbi:MAG: tRNA 2-thiocytidine biosynthesis protein TtcA, partial [Desulfovibrio sp.]|nr:tRNA 2-thiocytidine biosynthesis protein TtcA [Desulfovibrio sp.]